MKSFFEKLRRRKGSQTSSAQAEISTVPLSDKQIQSAINRVPRVEPPQLIHGCGQSAGKQRDQNEDALFAFNVTLGIQPNGIPFGLFVVADGMGGHQYGEVASGTAVRVLASHLLRKFHPYLLNPTKSLDESLQDIMHTATLDAQRAVMQSAPGSGTTLTAALIFGQQMIVAHVGDSRAYALRPDGHIETLTRDHTLVKRLEELGQITSNEAAAHPQRNVLYRALGQGETLEPDIFTTPFPQPGYLLLCSDGLWSVVQEDQINKIVRQAPNLHTACQSLVAAANEAGGPDNISVILVQLLS